MAKPRQWIRRRRKELRMTQRVFARRAGVKLRTVQRWEAGETFPDMEDQQSIALALDLAAEFVLAQFAAELGVEVTIAIPSDGDSLSAVWVPDATVALASHLTARDSMNRRTALKTLAVLSGAQLLEPLEGWLQPDTRRPQPSRMSTCQLSLQDVAQLESAARVLRALKGRGELGYKAVLGLLDDVSEALRRYQPSHVEQGLYRVMAILAQAAASVAWDAGMQRCAQDYYHLAIRAAHSGGDALFGANALAGLARQTFYLGHAQDGLELVRLAQAGLRGHTAPKLQAMLLTREAWGYAAAGRAAAFSRTTSLAYDSLAKAGPEEPQWMAYFDAGEIAGVAGGRLLEMARRDAEHAEKARDNIVKAIDDKTTKAGRGYVLDHIGLAECGFILNDTAAALADTHRALDLAEQVNSGRVQNGLKRLHRYVAGVETAQGRAATQRLVQLVQGAA